MKDHVAEQSASRMLRLVKVSEAIKARKKELQMLNPVCTVEELAEGWAEDIRFDMAVLVDEHGTFRSPKDLSRKTRRGRGGRRFERLEGSVRLEDGLFRRERGKGSYGRQGSFSKALTLLALGEMQKQRMREMATVEKG